MHEWRNVTERIKEMLQKGTLLLQISSPNRLLVIPFSSIQSIAVVPPPPRLPGIVIKVVREMAVVMRFSAQIVETGKRRDT